MAKRKMDQSEAWAKEYLLFRGFKPADVAFEPDGNVPPDFLVEGRIAVEVRRLNQHWHAATGDSEPLEKLSVPLLIRLRKLIEGFGPPPSGVSWDVFWRFGRPQLRQDWEPILRRELQPFHDGQIRDKERTIHIGSNFKLRLVQRARPDTCTFVLAGGSDIDAGGWVIPELEKSLTICVREKSVKIAKYRAKYPEWWLVLVDHMTGGTPKELHVEHDWDTVLIIHPSNLAWAYEVRNTKVRNIRDF
jgi:hypothetical protein